ncbi:MAG: biopolymer transporter ExbD [Myxococcales bacterium]|nr:biopolymer transporter ExbD [Myxococcales bacterium]
MAGGAKQDDDELITAINVTPLVDIVLVLLIVLMVTSSYLVNKSINVELPKAATGETTSQSMSISIDKGGQLYLDGAEVETSKLQEKIRDAYRRDHDVKAVISADGRVQHSQVVTVIDILRREKVTKFAINTSPIEQAKK